MISIKEVTERFEVTRATLHNWKTTKPRLYNLLLNSDGCNDELREINHILEKYAKTIKEDFTIDEVKFLLELKLEEHISDIEKIHTVYIEQTSKDIKNNTEFILKIYQKIEKLDIIKKYILISRIKSIKKLKPKPSEMEVAIKHYFKEFLTNT